MNSDAPLYDLNNEILPLLRDEPFFARISARLKKVADESLPTAGVRFCKESLNFELAYNPRFMGSLSSTFRKGVLKHEFYHIALGHCFGARAPSPKLQRIANVAMDLAINSLPDMVDMLPDWTLLPGRAPHENLPSGQSYEWYFKHLSSETGEGTPEQGPAEDDSKNAANQPGEASGQLGSHEWNSTTNSAGKAGEGNEGISDAMMEEIAKQKLEDLVRDAVEETMNAENKGESNVWGSVSRSMRRQIQKFVAPKLDPKAVLRSFVKTSVKADHRKSITKVNRRWAYIHPGRRHEHRAQIAISIDQSGSVTDSMLEAFFGFLNELAKYAEFTVIPFDDRVFEDKIYIWKKGEKRARARVLCGGTNFDSPTDWVNKAKKFDAHIVVTDMCARAPKKSKCKRLWITTKSWIDSSYARAIKERCKEKVLAVD